MFGRKKDWESAPNLSWKADRQARKDRFGAELHGPPPG